MLSFKVCFVVRKKSQKIFHSNMWNIQDIFDNMRYMTIREYKAVKYFVLSNALKTTWTMSWRIFCLPYQRPQAKKHNKINSVRSTVAFDQCVISGKFLTLSIYSSTFKQFWIKFDLKIYRFLKIDWRSVCDFLYSCTVRVIVTFIIVK